MKFKNTKYRTIAHCITLNSIKITLTCLHKQLMIYNLNKLFFNSIRLLCASFIHTIYVALVNTTTNNAKVVSPSQWFIIYYSLIEITWTTVFVFESFFFIHSVS